jgi:NADPH:quinone reductase-like Zn-dependent oxidoreductase
VTNTSPPKGITDDINPVGCEASESAGKGLTLNVDNVDLSKLVVCRHSGCLRPHFRPSIASAPAERAEAYAALLLLIPGGEIAPAFDRSFPLKEAPEAWRHLIEDRPLGKVALTVGALPDLRPYERPLALLQKRSAVP